MVLDTNVVLSALVFVQGRLAPLRQAWQQGRCHPLISTATAAELMRALQYPKFKLLAEEQKELLADYLPYCTTVRMPTKLPKTPPCRDPFDICSGRRPRGTRRRRFSEFDKESTQTHGRDQEKRNGAAGKIAPCIGLLRHGFRLDAHREWGC